MHESTNLDSFHLRKRARTASDPEADEQTHGEQPRGGAACALTIPRPSLKSLVALTGTQIPSAQPQQGLSFTNTSSLSTSGAPSLPFKPSSRMGTTPATLRHRSHSDAGSDACSDACSDAGSDSMVSDASSEADVALSTELFAAGNLTPLAAGAIVRGSSSFDEACRMLLEGTAAGDEDEEAPVGPDPLVW